MSWPSGAHEDRAPLIGCWRRELLMGQVAETRIWTFPNVLDALLFDLAANVVGRNEEVLVEEFLAQARTETLDVCVDRLAWFDEPQPYAMLVGLTDRASGRPGRDRGMATTSFVQGVRAEMTCSVLRQRL